ncbi:redox-sensing transcriptional repressor Rex [Phosphitispora fastidiosa]|uniref:redox-sensing transcriptional repressor Rex n=1 Tax=Phosphitispora fastidiosa TaxID=2837202 RepID=UPI001E3B0B1B|nr:redox-sensing transcriptional repressor Rex [Phosphitispora fastidiosa]MBU7008733.1 redox-sensing transcriptional repressor [Phosphitispora fastidiosa]
MKNLKIPEATIVRLSVYSRFLEQADKKGIITISSGEIAEGVGVSPAQVRKDLAYFGEFGTRGVGYNVKDLLRHTLKILGLNTKWPVVVLGAGNLGSALVSYRGFRERGFDIVGVFDNDLSKIGKRLMDLEVLGTEKLEKLIIENNVKIGILTVPASAAQEAANQMINAGVKAILNFAPTVLSVPEDVEVRDIDLSTRLEILTFHLCLKDML